MIQIEINLLKLERGTHIGRVKVTRGGKTFWRKQRVGVKEAEKPEKVIGMSEENVISSASGNEIGLGWSFHFSDIEIIEFKDGSKAIHKSDMEPYQIIGETEYYNINNILGWNICPETVEIDMGKGAGSCQKWISDANEPYFGDNGIKIEEKHFDDLAKIFVQDIIVGNRDRHHLNVVIKDDKCYAIDNENWGNPIPRQDYMEALDSRVGLGESEMKVPMLEWLDKSLSVEDYTKFRQRVIKYIRYALKYKGAIIGVYSELYDKYYDSSNKGISRGADSIKWNIESLEDYLKGGEL